MRTCRTILLAVLWLLSAQPEAPAQTTTTASGGSERRWSTWHFGYGAGLDFNGPTPRPVTGPIATLEGVSSISDPTTGVLLFSTDGTTLWNRLGRPTPRGRNLGGHESSTQSALVVPLPGSTSRYLLFTVDAFEDLDRRGEYTGLSSCVVDMMLDGGMGDVEAPPIRLEPPIATEKLCAVRRCRDGTLWVLAHEGESNRFYAFHVTASGITATVTSAAGDVHGIRSDDPQRQSDLTGYLKASPDGRRLVAVRGGAPTQIFDFNIETGRVTLAYSIPDTIFGFYGISFSPNGRLLYAAQNLATGGLLVQYDLAAGDPYAVARSRRTIAAYRSNVGALQLGPDLRLYIAVDDADRLDVIDAPDSIGVACGWHRSTVDLSPGRSGWGLPNAIDGELVIGAASAGSDATICPGDSARLHAVNAAQARWDPPEGLGCVDCLAPLASPRRTTTYTVTLTSLNGCTRVDSVTVTVNAPPPVEAGSDLALCAGESVTLDGRGASRLRWSPTTGLSCADCPAPIATPAATTTYHLTTWSVEGCAATDSVTVVVHPRPKVAAGPDTTVCEGTTAQLRATGAVAYRWSPADGLSCVDCPDPVALVSAPISYVVVGMNSAGCTASDTVCIDARMPAPAVASIAPSRRIAINRRGVVSILLDPATAATALGEVTVRVTHRPDLLRLMSARVRTSQGWIGVQPTSPAPGVEECTFDRPAGVTSDTLVHLEFQALLADTTAALVDLAVSTPSACLAWTGRSGVVRLDSLCGLALRLQRFAVHGLAREPSPNPFTDALSVALALATPAHVTIVLLDAAGREVLRAYDAPAAAGPLGLDLDAATLSSGLYLLRVDLDGTTVAVRPVERR